MIAANRNIIGVDHGRRDGRAPAHSAALDKNIATSYTAPGAGINSQNDSTNTPQSGTLGPFERAN